MGEVVQTFIFDKPQPRSRIKKRLKNLCDSLFSIFVVAPLCVMFWRGTWNYMDANPGYFPGLATFFLGGTMHSIFSLSREYFVDLIRKSKSRKTMLSKMVRSILLRINTYVFAISIVNHWRGGWAIFDQVLGRLWKDFVLFGLKYRKFEGFLKKENSPGLWRV